MGDIVVNKCPSNKFYLPVIVLFVEIRREETDEETFNIFPSASVKDS